MTELQPAWPGAPGEPLPQPAAQQPAVKEPVDLPAMLVAAAIILFILGVLAGLFGLLMLVTGLAYEAIQLDGQTGPSLADEAAGGRVVGITFGVVAMVAAAVQIGTGIGILRRAGWARITGIAFAALSAVIAGLIAAVFVLTLSIPLNATDLQGSGLTEAQYDSFRQVGAGVAIGIFGGAFAAYVFVMTALIRRGSAFR
jgi:hypothetical protein